MTFASGSANARPRKVSLAKLSDATGPRGPLVGKLGAAFQQDTAQSVLILKYMQFAILAGLVILVGLLANFSTTSYRMFATTTEGKLTMPPPVDQEIGDNVVSLWLIESMTRTMTIGFHDYQLRLLEIRPIFNDRGWDSFTRFQRSPYAGNTALRVALESNFLMMKCRPRAPPQILEKYLVGGIFTYKIQVKMFVTRYVGGQESVTNETFELLVERVKPEVNPAGIAIAQWRYIGSS